jgi:hypothetical protein
MMGTMRPEAQMTGEETLLRSLLRLRHLTTHEAFNAQLRRTARQLAEREGDPRLAAVTVSERQLKRWVNGGVATMPRADTCRVLEAMFGHPVRVLLGPAEPPAPDQPGIADTGRPGDEIGRTLSMAARRARQFSATADTTNVGPDSLGQLQDEAARLAQAYPVESLALLLPDLAALQDDTLTLLEGRQPPGYARDLYVLAALASGMLAKACHDLRDPRTAMTHARLAWQCASNAGHDALGAWVRGLESLIKYWDGQPREAREYALAGLDIPAAGTVRVWLYALQGRAEAALGNPAGALAAVEQAASAREQVRGDDLDAIGGICRFDVERELYYAADAGVRIPPQLARSPLGARAAGYAQQAISAYGAAAAPAFGDQAGAHSALAIARVRAGDVDGAAEAVAPVLALPPAMRINGVVSSAVAVHRELAPVASASTAADTQAAIEAFCHVPVMLPL